MSFPTKMSGSVMKPQSDIHQRAARTLWAWGGLKPPGLARALCTPNPDTGESPRMCCTCCCCPREPSRRPTSRRLHRLNPDAIPRCCWRSRNSGPHLGLWRWHAPAERTRGIGGPPHLFPSNRLTSLTHPFAGSLPATSPPPQLQVLSAVESSREERATRTPTHVCKGGLRG